MTLYKILSLIPRRQETEADVEEAVEKYEVQEKQVVEKEEVAKEA